MLRAKQAGQSRVGKASSALVGSRQPQGDPGKRQSPNFFLQAVGTSAQWTSLQNRLWGPEPAALPPAGEKALQGPLRALLPPLLLQGSDVCPFCRFDARHFYNGSVRTASPSLSSEVSLRVPPPWHRLSGLGSQDVVPGPSPVPLCPSSCRVARSLCQEQRHM